MYLNARFSTILLLSFFTVVFSACRKSDDATNDLSGTYEINLQQTVVLPKDGKKATLTFVDFNDSRCPINANCVTAGSVIATFLFRDGLIKETFKLCLGDCTEKEKIVTSNGIKYSLSLIDLTPYPQTSALVLTRPVQIAVLVKRI